jgi:hypothetical protein
MPKVGTQTTFKDHQKHKILCVVVATLTLGSQPRQGIARLCAKRKTHESHHMLPGVQRVWGNEPSHSQVNSNVGSWSCKWTPKSSKRNFRDQNPLPCIVLYTIGKLLKRKCLKWACITHLDISNTSYGQKKSQESNWQFNSRPLKVGNWPDFLARKQRATYCSKAFDQRYNFVLDCERTFARKVMCPQSHESPSCENFKTPIWEPMTKNHLDAVAPVESYKVYFKGEGGGFPQVRAVLSLVSLRLV